MLCSYSNLQSVIIVRSFFLTFCSTLWSIGHIFHFHDHFTDGRTPWTGDQLVAKPLLKHGITQTQIKCIHTLNMLPCVGFEPTIPSSERAKAVHALERTAIVTGFCFVVTKC
jgi:hypothetical protein